MVVETKDAMFSDNYLVKMNVKNSLMHISTLAHAHTHTHTHTHAHTPHTHTHAHTPNTHTHTHSFSTMMCASAQTLYKWVRY